MGELRFDDKVAVVTGAGRGLGRSHAELLAARGACVVVNDPGVGLAGEGGDEGPASEVVEGILAGGGQAVADFGSVASEYDARAMIARALDTFGGLDIVVNNAGNFVPLRPFEETSGESFASLWQVHVMGTINVTRAAWPHLKAKGYGRVVNTASHVGYLGAPGNLEYGTAKTAIHGFTRGLSYEAAEHGIAINAIAPGGLTRPVLAEYPDFPQELAEGAFAPGLVSPTVAWLAHEECLANGEVFGVMAGTTSRIKIAETHGYVSRSPTPEAIRDSAAQIMDEQAIEGADLTFGVTAVGRGFDLIERYNGAE